MRKSVGQMLRRSRALRSPLGERNRSGRLPFQAKFTQAISLMVSCNTQAELNRYWKKLTSGGGKEVACGWLQDKYGLSWQIVPKDIIQLISDKDPAKVDRVMTAVMKMVKLDIKKLKAANAGMQVRK